MTIVAWRSLSLRSFPPPQAASLKAVADAWLADSVYSVTRFRLKGGRPRLPETYWPELLWTLPFFFMAHTTEKSVRNPKPAQFTSIHESVTSASLRAPLRWAGGLCGWNPPPPYFSNSAKLFKLTFHLFKARKWNGMCRNSSLLWVLHSIFFLFPQHTFHKDRWRIYLWFEVIGKLILLKEARWERRRQRETWYPVTVRRLWNWQLVFLCLSAC